MKQMKQMKQIGKDQSFHVNQELEGSSQRRWTLIAAGILAAVLLVLILILFFFIFFRNREGGLTKEAEANRTSIQTARYVANEHYIIFGGNLFLYHTEGKEPERVNSAEEAEEAVRASYDKRTGLYGIIAVKASSSGLNPKTCPYIENGEVRTDGFG